MSEERQAVVPAAAGGAPGTPYRFRASHRVLLRTPALRRAVETAGAGARTGLVAVPASRASGTTSTSLRLAQELGWPVLVLCSKAARAASVRAAARAEGLAGSLIVADLPRRTTLARSVGPAPAGGGAWRAAQIDTDDKRNVVLAAARMLGVRHVLFLDDDVWGLAPTQVRAALGVLALDPQRNWIHGWALGDFQDNSVVCHANRESGNGSQDTFVGGGALLVDMQRYTAWFPDVYNEDWLFLYDALAVGAVLEGHDVRQLPYDPFHQPLRARREEFGDVLAEGLYHLLHERAPVELATDPGYWRPVRAERRRLIDAVRGRLQERLRSQYAPSAVRTHNALVALAAARNELSRVTPEALAGFVVSWRADQERWRDWVVGLPGRATLQGALTYLGFPPGSVLTGAGR